MKNIRVFYLKNFQFLEVEFSIYLNRRVIVMSYGSNVNFRAAYARLHRFKRNPNSQDTRTGPKIPKKINIIKALRALVDRLSLSVGWENILCEDLRLLHLTFNILHFKQTVKFRPTYRSKFKSPYWSKFRHSYRSKFRPSY